jgi:hypothetical protein
VQRHRPGEGPPPRAAARGGALLAAARQFVACAPWAAPCAVPVKACCACGPPDSSAPACPSQFDRDRWNREKAAYEKGDHALVRGPSRQQRGPTWTPASRCCPPPHCGLGCPVPSPAGPSSRRPPPQRPRRAAPAARQEARPTRLPVFPGGARLGGARTPRAPRQPPRRRAFRASCTRGAAPTAGALIGRRPTTLRPSRATWMWQRPTAAAARPGAARRRRSR